MELSVLNLQSNKEKQLIAKKLNSIEDILYFFPRKYYDFSHPVTVNEAVIGSKCAVLAKVESVEFRNTKNSYILATLMEPSTQMEFSVIWFRQEYRLRELQETRGKEVLVCGTINMGMKRPEFLNPDYFSTDVEGGMRIIPVYSKIRGMSSEYFTDKVLLPALDLMTPSEPVPESVRRRLGVCTEEEMIRKFHFPKSIDDVIFARKKQITNIIYAYGVKLEADSGSMQKRSGFVPKYLSGCNKVIKSLPYELTTDQKNIITEFVTTAQRGERVNALIQGDVGSGKSICAFLLMMAMADNGYQSVLMAPTGILAKQHYEELCSYASLTGKTAVYLGADVKGREKSKILAMIKDGAADFVVGTHSVIGSSVEYHCLGLTVVDEEHKFGVIQRDALKEKANEGVHSISMSATPIPRSLAIATYGDAMSIYSITTMPNGRLPVKTALVNNERAAYAFMLKQIKEGHQCYIVCPMITPDEKEDIKEDGNQAPTSVEEAFSAASRYLGPYGVKAACVTGKMKAAEKDQILSDFKEGNIDVLIATTIIEVGVNVPNATVISIENAERYGLAGLHQLRGRVGRSKLQSYCMLRSTEKNNPRLSAMCNTTDGFKIAEEDLKLRGAGDIIGTKQSGEDENFLTVLKYPRILAEIRRMIKEGQI